MKKATDNDGHLRYTTDDDDEGGEKSQIHRRNAMNYQFNDSHSAIFLQTKIIPIDR